MEVKTDEPVTEDYRSDRLILEELSGEVRRLHQRLDDYEKRLIGNPLGRWAWGWKTPNSGVKSDA